MFLRLLLLFLIVWFLIWLIRSQFAPYKKSNRAKPSEAVEDMVACAYCGTHIPKSIAVIVDGKSYCCDEHADLDRQA